MSLAYQLMAAINRSHRLLRNSVARAHGLSGRTKSRRRQPRRLSTVSPLVGGDTRGRRERCLHKCRALQAVDNPSESPEMSDVKGLWEITVARETVISQPSMNHCGVSSSQARVAVKATASTGGRSIQHAVTLCGILLVELPGVAGSRDAGHCGLQTSRAQQGRYAISDDRSRGVCVAPARPGAVVRAPMGSQASLVRFRERFDEGRANGSANPRVADSTDIAAATGAV